MNAPVQSQLTIIKVSLAENIDKISIAFFAWLASKTETIEYRKEEYEILIVDSLLFF